MAFLFIQLSYLGHPSVYEIENNSKMLYKNMLDLNCRETIGKKNAPKGNFRIRADLTLEGMESFLEGMEKDEMMHLENKNLHS